jgi:hypothetical protein
MKLTLLGTAIAAGALTLSATAVGSARPSGAPTPLHRDALPQAQVVGGEYDGRYTFVRVRYGGRGRDMGRFGGGFYGGGGNWNHDYPYADLNMQAVLKELTLVEPHTETSVVVDLEDPAIFDYPILYMSEPGFWQISEEGAQNLRTHLLKGGFIIFDDFDGYGHWENWLAQIKRALPEYDPIPIGETHPVFQTFFFVEDIYVPNPMVRGLPKPTYFGFFEDNDPTKRMLALVNYNSDLAEYWEYLGRGFLAIDPTNDAFRLGVNYIIYGLTH